MCGSFEFNIINVEGAGGHQAFPRRLGQPHLQISLPATHPHQGQGYFLPIQTFNHIRDLMKYNAQELVNEALKRAVRRDASLSTLEVGDLLWAIERRECRM
jgi:hypothetical protein